MDFKNLIKCLELIIYVTLIQSIICLNVIRAVKPATDTIVVELNENNPVQYIQSPGFPKKTYPNNYRVNYELKINTNNTVDRLSSRIRIKLEYIAIEPSDNCQDSNLQIIFPNGEIRVFCRLHLSKTMIADTGSARIEFRGNARGIDRGFKIKTELIQSKCSQTLVDLKEGFIESPNYPNNYGLEETCVWQIQVPLGKFVRLEFEDNFNIKTSSEICAEDYLLISRSGDLDTDSIRFCGNEKPSVIVSHSNKILIKFNSDCCESGKGFRAKFIEHDKPEAAPEKLPMLTPPDCPCGKENLKLVKRIVGGKEVDPPHRYPWMVSVVSSVGSSFCGGALINNQYVLTAAHCVIDEIPDSIGVRIGQHSLKESTPILKISNITLHKDYDSVSQFNDIALLKLSKPIQYTDYIQPVCLPPSDLEDPDGLFVSGWGRIDEGGRTSDRLHEITVPGYSLPKCEKKYMGLITEKQLCAGGVKGQDACQGDSGGPLASRINGRVDLVGVVSWGIGCAREGSPGVYTRVSAYLKWIEEHTKDGKYCLPIGSNASNNTIDQPIQPNFANCGQPNLKIAKRVVGGTDTIPQEFPWTVVIAYNGQLIGSGSLIAANVVLTAAKRLKTIYGTGISPDVKIIVGAHDITKTEASKQVYRVNQIVFHPKFGSNTPNDYDFALIELKPSSDGSVPTQKPVCLPRSDTPYATGSPVIGVGWGRTSTFSAGSNTLKKVTLNLSDRRNCTQVYQYSVTNSMVCAYADKRDMCLGDQGGPLMQYYDGRMYLLGVYSWQSPEGCASGKPSVFGDVRYALEWIRQVTGNAIKTA